MVYTIAQLNIWATGYLPTYTETQVTKLRIHFSWALIGKVVELVTTPILVGVVSPVSEIKLAYGP